MVSGEEPQPLVSGVRISSVGPGKMFGLDGGYHLSGRDLAMKLHYIKAIYYFDSEASRNLTVPEIKAATFVLFNDYYMTCGRLRREDSGRPFIKCNDCGARFIEAECRMTLAEWLEMIGEDSPAQRLLASDKVIGPELHFSPPVYMQLTRFKCKGISIGLSWAHVLSDAFSPAAFMNSLAALLFGGAAPTSATPPLAPAPGIANITATLPPKLQSSAAAKPPLSLRRIDPVGDHWIPTNNSNMKSFSFNLSATQLAELQTQMPHQTPPFESIAAVLWQSIASLRRGSEPTAVTLCKLDPVRKQGKVIGNHQKISTVKSAAAADRRELADLLVAGAAEDEGDLIEEAVDRDDGVSDFIVYGANLTFVKWDEADLYGEENGLDFERPKFVYYTVDGVGDGGAVVVVPGLGLDGGRFVTVILPENEVAGLKAELITNGMLLEKHRSNA